MKRNKIKKKMIKIILWIMILLLLFVIPVMVLPLVLQEGMAIENGKISMNYLGLLISVYTLEATIALAFVIYGFQKRDAVLAHRKRIEFAKTAMGTALESGIRRIILPDHNLISGMASSTTDIFKEYMVELQELLRLKQYRCLIKIVETIDSDINKKLYSEDLVERTDMDLFIRDWLWILSKSKYYCLFESVDITDIYNRETFELLKNLGIVEGDFKEIDCITDKRGMKIIERKEQTGCYRIFNNQKLILEGKIGIWDAYDDSIKILNGYECSSQYDGNYQDGFFEGQGYLTYLIKCFHFALSSRLQESIGRV